MIRFRVTLLSFSGPAAVQHRGCGPDLPEATYTVTVDYMGYIPLEKKVRVERGKTVNVTIPLKAEPLSLEQATVTAKTEAVKQVLSLSGNLAYIHFFE